MSRTPVERLLLPSLPAGEMLAPSRGTMPRVAPGLQPRDGRWRMSAKAGDRIVVESQKAGQPAREGEILEVVASSFGIRYEVRWADGHTRTFSPSGGRLRIHELPNRGGQTTPPSSEQH